MSTILALLLSASTASAALTAPSFTAPSTPYTLAVDTTGADRHPNLTKLEQQMDTAHRIYRLATGSLVGGAVATGVGLTVGIFGLIPALANGNNIMAIAGFTTAAVGGSMVLVSVPMFTVASWTGAAPLQQHGIDVSRYPGLLMIGGLSVAIIGTAADIPPMQSLGSVALLAGSAAQVTMARRAFNAYNVQQARASAQVSLVPRWSPGDGVGTSLVVTF